MSSSLPRHAPVSVTEILRQRWDVLAVIAAGGALGSAARWGVGELLPHRPGDFPTSTLMVNVVGSFLLGLLMIYVLEIFSTPGRYLRPFAGVGFMGGFTTFSTYILDTHALASDGEPATLLAYGVGSVLLVLAAVSAGVGTTRLLARVLHEPRHPAAASDEPEVE